MGTFNYCSDQADSKLHQTLDVKPYKEYGNTPDPSSKYPGKVAKKITKIDSKKTSMHKKIELTLKEGLHNEK